MCAWVYVNENPIIDEDRTKQNLTGHATKINTLIDENNEFKI